MKDRTREAVFNLLGPSVKGKHAFDLFAGTGALGLEALSRGAAAVTFVEKSATAVASLRESIATLGAESAYVLEGDAIDYLNGEPRRFDIVFLDPPFADDLPVCRLLNEGGWLAEDARVYLEQERHHANPFA